MAERKRAGRPPLEQDPLVEALVPDPNQGPPDATVLQGYLGKSTTEGVWRLYLTPQLDQYVELPEAEILYSQKQPDDGTLVWVRRDLPLNVQRPQAAQVQAEFLGGNIAGARLRQAATAGGVGAFRERVVPRPPISVVAPCPSAVDACPSVRIVCGHSVRFCPTRVPWRCPPSFGFICPSIHIPCGVTVSPEVCPSLGIACTVVGCGGASEIDACPTWICGPTEVVDPLL